MPIDTDVGATGLEDILEVVTRGYVKNCGPLNALCQEANFYQLYTREYVQHLGDYLLKRTAARRSSGDAQPQHGKLQNNGEYILNETPLVSTDTVVLDIGAGDGLLMHCLRDYMERKVMGLSLTDSRKGKQKRDNRASKNNRQTVIPKMVATDDMSWKIFAKAEVEKLSVEQALEKYTTKASTETSSNGTTDETSNERPLVIVICSWMPMGQDWTSLFRKAGVDEYILIGEADDGSCGDNWLTWGNPAFCEAAETTDGDDSPSSPTPPYIEEGYKRVDMDPLTKYQFSSFDLANSKSSKTVSFRRRKQK